MSSWVRRGNLRGGPPGPRGSRWFVGSGPVDEAALYEQGARPGDLYFDVGTGSISEYTYTPPVTLRFRVVPASAGVKFSALRFGARTEVPTDASGVAALNIYHSDFRVI